MQHRIYFSVCGEGYGHSSRDIAIAKVLQNRGAKVLMGSYGYALERMKKGFKTVEVEREFEMAGRGGAFDLGATISKSSGKALLFSETAAREQKIIEKFRATCVVADGRGAAILSAFRLGLPCIVISNQTSLERFFDKYDILRRLGDKLDRTYTASIVLADEAIIPDFEPPHTVCLPTLSRYKHVMKKQVFTGPIVSENILQPKKGLVDVKKPLVLTILGGHAFRRPIFDGILKAAEKFPEITFLIFTKFEREYVPGNVVVREFAEDISKYMSAAEIIVTQAGHSTAMEILALGKPALVIPDAGQAEQEQNARRMKELGVAEVLDYDHLAPKEICAKIRRLLDNSAYRKNAARYSKMAKKMNGAKKAADMILELSGRIQKY